MEKVKAILGKAKKTINVAKQKAKEDPFKATSLATGVAGISIGATNLMSNKKRQREAKDFQERQLDAMNKLTNSLGKVDNSLKHAQIPSVSTPVTNQENDNTMTKFKKKLFSIENGGYKGGKRPTPSILGATAKGLVGGAIGGGILGGVSKGAEYAGKGVIIGAGIGAFTGLLVGIADRSEFKSPQSTAGSFELIGVINSRYYDEGGQEATTCNRTIPVGDSYKNGYPNGGTVSVQKTVVTNKRARKLLPYEIDADPRSCVVSVLLRAGVLVMYINDPVQSELNLLNKILDGYCYKYRTADYKAKTVSKNCYMVEVVAVGNPEIIVNSILAPIMRASIKVNFVTGNKINVPHQNKVHFKPKPQEREYSLKSDMLSGAATGAGLGGVAGLLTKNKNVLGMGKEDNFQKSLIMVGAGTIVGAALGALVSGVKSIAQNVNRKNTVDARLMQGVVDDLNKSGFKEGIDYTRNPKVANDLSIKVSMVISKVSGEMNLLVNTVSDSKLKNVTDSMVSRIPNSSAVTKKATDKYNDITITTISDNSANTGLISGICGYFIHHGYPVYLVEVG